MRAPQILQRQKDYVLVFTVVVLVLTIGKVGKLFSPLKRLHQIDFQIFLFFRVGEIPKCGVGGKLTDRKHQNTLYLQEGANN
ncbi:unnamed protein product [Allacma fusca]|uniref:Uncharacterized protein n=1 Tax=Allacma fusca TaxID=39272 RepID=A0A8J2P8M8_9HEXA|nr:unnamed protein product [Allacma fusca]